MGDAMKHKHADLIHAWADGAQIQCKQYGYDHRWADVGYPNWENPYCEYRIKPEPKPNIVRQVVVEATSPMWVKVFESGKFPNFLPPNLMLIFDGETGKLKEAVVL